MDCGKLGGGKFQSTLPQGKWLPVPALTGVTEIFQSTLPQGKWQLFKFKVIQDILFQSTLPQGKWRTYGSYNSSHGKFQSTLPQGKWPRQSCHLQSFTHFNPHFRKGSDDRRAGDDRSKAISIHTSAREVTWIESHRLKVWQISIHTSAREVTVCRAGMWATLRHFNPHFRKGSDCNIPQKHLSIFMKYL